jgi:O-antigen/teichoic acid export membrane protein
LSDSRRIATNSFWLGLGFGGSKFFTIILNAVAGRVLGPAGFGLIGIASALAEVGKLISGAGLDYLVAREVASDPAKAPRLSHDVAVVKLVNAAIVYVLLAFVVSTLDYPRVLLPLVLIFGTALFLENLSDLLDAVFQGVQRMRITTVAFLISGLVVLSTGVAALLGGLGLRAYAACFALGFLARFLVMFTAARRARLVEFSHRGIDHAETRRLVLASLPLLASTGLALIFHRMDLLMLGKLEMAAQVGLYTAAIRVIDSVVLVPRVLGTALYPALRQTLEEDPEGARRLLAESSRITLAVCSGIGVLVWVLAPWALRITPGPEFVPATEVLRLLSYGIVLQGLAHVVARLLLAIDAERDFLIAVSVSLVVNFGLNLWLIERMGISGAAWATLIAYAVNISLYLVAAWRRGHALPWRSGIGGPLLAMLLAVLAATNPAVPGTAGVKLVIVWMVVLLMTRGLRPADIGQLLDVIRRRNTV